MYTYIYIYTHEAFLLVVTVPKSWMYDTPLHPSAPTLTREAAGILFASVGRTGSNSAHEEGGSEL